MKWYYEFEGKPAGPVSESDLNQLRAEGKVTPDTLVWCKGMDQWQKAEQVVYDFSPKSRHPESDEDLADLKPDSIVEPNDWQEAHLEPEHGEVAPSWENPSMPSKATAFLNTVIEVLFHPMDTFRRLHCGESWVAPLLFFALSQCIGGVFYLLTIRFSPALASLQSPQPALGKIILPILVLQALTSPIQAALGSAILHGSLWLAGCRSRPFAISFRVFCYGMGSSALLLGFMVIAVVITAPFQDASLSQRALSISSLVFLLWLMVVLLKAIQATQGVGIFRALMVLLLLALWASLALFAQGLDLGSAR